MMLWVRPSTKQQNFLGIEFPGGPKIEEWAKKGDENYFKLPKPIF